MTEYIKRIAERYKCPVVRTRGGRWQVFKVVGNLGVWVNIPEFKYETPGEMVEGVCSALGGDWVWMTYCGSFDVMKRVIGRSGKYVHSRINHRLWKPEE
jgi:hypothetical protein